MPRDMDPQDAREASVSKLTDKHFQALKAKLQGGDPELVATIDEAVFANASSSFYRDLVVSATNAKGALIVGSAIVRLVDDALFKMAFALAEAEAEQLVAEAAEEFDEPDKTPFGAPLRGPWNYCGRL